MDNIEKEMNRVKQTLLDLIEARSLENMFKTGEMDQHLERMHKQNPDLDIGLIREMMLAKIEKLKGDLVDYEFDEGGQ